MLSERRRVTVSFQANLRVEQLEGRDLPSATVPLDPTQPHVLATANDTYSGSQFGLTSIKAQQAWDTTTGSTKVVVAAIDSGVDYTHPDLYLNVWINQGEIPAAIKSQLIDVDGDGLFTFRDLNDSRNQGSGKIQDWNGNGRIDGGDLLDNRSGWENAADSDGNGYRDDLIGWNFVRNTNDPYDDNGHGTHTFGTIGAIGNNSFGVTGVAWSVQIVALKFLDANGGGSLSNAAKAIRYAADNGARASNNSWGYYGGSTNDVVYQAIVYAQSKNHLVIAAAGNDGVNNDSSAWKSYPAAFPLSNIVTVAALDSSDRKPNWSNFGKTSVDLGAPGASILSTVPGGYAYYSGTSMATPHVTGAVALLLAKNPSLSASDLKAALLNNTDAVTALRNNTVTGGKLNVSKALNAVVAGAAATGAVSSGSTGSAGGTGTGTSRFLQAAAWQGGNWQGIDWAAAAQAHWSDAHQDALPLDLTSLAQFWARF
jgi:subtilisin family serine protease